MTPDQHAQAKELFLQARDLSPEQRQEFIRRQCGDDEELLREVSSLIQHDTADTILTHTTRTQLDTRLQRRRTGRLLGQIERSATRLLMLLLRNTNRQLLVFAAAAALLIALAFWTYHGMKRSSQVIARAELKTILNAEVQALEFWIEEKKKDVWLWSSQYEIRSAVAELLEISDEPGDPVEKLRTAPAQERLQEVLDFYDRIADRPERDAIVTRDGLLIAAGRDEAIGQRLNAKGVAALLPVFEGETLFLKPRPEGEFGSDGVVDPDLPILYVVAPVYADDTLSHVIAAAGFGFPADHEFTRILSVARKGETGETYAFDSNGLLLNESRFEDELRENGLLTPDPQSTSILRIEIRDPGSDPQQWKTRTAVEAAERPFTRLAAEAIAAGRKGVGGDALENQIVDGYRNYRGVQVIGAWRWLPAYSMAVATEVEYKEQFAPIGYPLAAEWIRFSLLVGSVVALLAAAGWIVILHRDVDHAHKLGQYTLEEQIGEGGMGVVYRARHSLLRRPTAIKLLRSGMVSKSSLARFEREVQIASSLTHPSTIDIFDFGATPDGSFYCAMEYLEGQTLEETVRSGGAMEPTRVIPILLQIAGSLREAHTRGLVHRDIKPANVMLCEQGGIPDFVKVLDFGLAREMEPEEDTEVTRTAIVVGTPPYLAPERITDPINVDARSDIYAWGAVGYYLLTGRHIYNVNDAKSLEDILDRDPPSPSENAPNQIPEELDELVRQCIARSPDERPGTMQEVIERLGGR